MANHHPADYCQNITYILKDGISLKQILNNEVTLVYSFDSMVHFDSDVVRAYLKEFQRMLRPGGLGFCHYSNYTDQPTGDYPNSPHWRNSCPANCLNTICGRKDLCLLHLS